MTVFAYKAIDQFGRTIRHHLDVDNESDLVNWLDQMGMDLISVKPVSRVRLWLTRRSIKPRERWLFCFQLAQSLASGVPLIDSLQDLNLSVQNPEMQTIIACIRADVESGQSFSQALAKHHKVFDNVFVSLIAAGEQTGQLPMVLNYLAETLKWQDRLLAASQRLLIYPFVLLTVVTIAIVILMHYLVPELVQFIQGLGQELPWNTRLLMALSEGFIRYGWLILLLLCLIIFFTLFAYQRYAGWRERCDYLKLKLPLLGQVHHQMAMARFARYLAMMYKTGIPLLDAVYHGRHIVGNAAIANTLGYVHAQITAGVGLSDSFKQTCLFTPLIVRMLRIGEQTGALDDALMQASAFYERDVHESTQQALKLLEPLLTIVLGLLLLFIMSAVLLPVYDSFKVMVF